MYTSCQAKNNVALYIGVTSNLERRIWEHRNNVNIDGFASKYNCVKLVYFEEYNSIDDAIKREKQLKAWKREYKDALVKKENSTWRDLSAGWM
ncbi:MAG: GIY-YIG nuclease family protein [Defluviitaleaceae bacterium]|nr:GIY-YIG nuclease family protein [Defluviitaleaceae bacterium]